MLRRALALTVAVAVGVTGLLCGRDAAAQVGIGRGREAEVLRLIQPFQDEGPVAKTTLARIAIRPDHIAFVLREPTGATATLKLLPADPDPKRPPPRSFRVERDVTDNAALVESQTLLLGAVAKNDDGQFFARPLAAEGPTPRKGSVLDAEADQRAPWLTGLAVALWVLLGLCIARAATGGGIPGTPWLSRSVLALVVLYVALQARREVPFWPIHANQHAYEDLGVALSLPESAHDAARAVAEYGPAWVTLQRQTVGVFGATHEGVARWSNWVGALAALFAFLAAARLAGPWRALPGALVVAWAPVAVRVGHSESPVVVAQLLVGVALWLAAGSRRVERVGVVVALLLLALGHPLGPALAGAVALSAWALAPLGTHHSKPAGDALALPTRPDAAEPRHTAALPWLAILVATVAVGLAIALWGNAGLLQGRAERTGVVPLPTAPHAFWLWLDPAWAPVSAMVPLALGVVGLWRGVRSSANRLVAALRTSAFALGVAGLTAAGFVVIACVSDGLRYQAPFAPLVCVAMALSWRAVRGEFAWRWPLRVVHALALVAVLLELTRTPPGATALDSQGHADTALRKALAHEKGDVWLLVPDRDDGPGPVARVPLEVPVGMWREAGPRVRPLLVGDAATACRTGMPLPQPLYVWLGPACHALETAGRAPPCRELGPYVDRSRPVVARGTVPLLAGASPRGLAGEFSRFDAQDKVAWELWWGRCLAAAAR
jgi:hypothetical protein